MGPSRGEHPVDDLAGLVQGLRLAVIALVSAAVTAGLVIGAGEAIRPEAHELLVRVAHR